MNIKSKFDFPENAILHDVRYFRKPECFEVVYLDPVSDKLELVYLHPMITIWFIKKEYRSKYVSSVDNKPIQASQALMEELYPVRCKPSQISKIIAQEMENDEYCSHFTKLYLENKDTMRENELKRLMCECPFSFKADFQPEAYFRLEWLHNHGDDVDVSKVTYGVLDIEVDVLDRPLDIKNTRTAPNPINAISIILPHKKIAALLVLGPRPKELLDKRFHELLLTQEKAFNWLKNNTDTFKSKILEFDKENIEYLRGFDLRVHIFDYRDEIKMIKTAFDYVNKYRPMFMLSWNAMFDHNYLPNRCAYLGYDPREFIIPKEFETEQMYYYIDKNPKKTNKTTKDWFYLSSYTTWVCQMKLFAQIRKSQAEQRSMRLAYIGMKFAKITKLTETKSRTFREFAYTDFINFLLYNMRDTVVQFAIEETVHDTQTLFSRSYMYATHYSKDFQETHIVRNNREYSFELDGYIMSNRLLLDPSIDPHYKAAYVAEPALNAPTGYILNGKDRNNIIFAAMDADAASYYPSTNMAENMDHMTLISKCLIDNKHWTERELINRSMNQQYIWYDSDTPPKPHAEDMSGPIINSYRVGNTNSVMYNWLNTLSISDICQQLDMAFNMSS